MLGNEQLKTPFGMRRLEAWPILDEPANAHPVYGDPYSLGASVKGLLTVNSNKGEIYGDDVCQYSVDVFAGAQFDTETTLSDLEKNAKLFGHTWAENDGEESRTTDDAPLHGLSCVEPVFCGNKTVYRATIFRRAKAMASSEKQDAETRKKGEFAPKNNLVSFDLSADNLNSWRVRNDFETEAAAEAFIKKTFGAAT